MPELDPEALGRCVGRIGPVEQRSEALLEMRGVVSTGTTIQSSHYPPGCPLPKLRVVHEVEQAGANELGGRAAKDAAGTV